VLIVDDVRAVCETLAAAVRAEPDLAVAGCATGLVEALPYMEVCDVILVNSNGEGSVQLISTLQRLAGRARIVVMGLAPGQQDTAAWINAGATSYITKECPLDELFHAIREAYGTVKEAAPHGVGWRAYLAEWMGFQRGGGFDESGAYSLTRREREVISLVRQGLTNQEIAEALVIELGTVKNHVHNILRKLKVTSRREAVHVTGQAGLWGPSENHRAVEAQPAWPVRRPVVYPGLVTANS
jgi:DNA-binding NarL/FixJ family response regulator